MTSEINKLVLYEVKKWSGDVKTDWSPPEGLFKTSAKNIAKVLKDNSSSYQEAMQRLTFYVNRAGKNLNASRRKELEKAKEELRKLYGRKE